MAKKTEEWVHIGVVGVDSGQMLLTDPCYIESEWDTTDDLDKVLTNEIILKRSDGSEVTLVRGRDVPFHWDTTFSFDGADWTLNALAAAGRLRKPAVVATNKYSYPGCCSVTCSEQKGGQLNYRAGHAGAGVCCESGLGDGLYDVFVKYGETSWGRRVMEMKVVFISDE